MGEIVAPPSVMWRHPDLKSGAKIRWQGLFPLFTQLCDCAPSYPPLGSQTDCTNFKFAHPPTPKDRSEGCGRFESALGHGLLGLSGGQFELKGRGGGRVGFPNLIYNYRMLVLSTLNSINAVLTIVHKCYVFVV